MPSPIFTFAFILATLWGAGFHLIVGGDARRLAIFLLCGWLGFALGQFMGITFEVDIGRMGSLHLVSASIGSLATLLFIYFFTRNSRPRRRRSPSR